MPARKIINMSYGTTLYQSNTLRESVRRYGVTLNTLLNEHADIVGIVSTGSSGAILAAGLMLRKLPRPLCHIHVNKPHEGRSHSGTFSGSHKKNGSYVFVDDFIYEGVSLQRCIDAFKDTSYNIQYAIVTRIDDKNPTNVKVFFPVNMA